MKKTITKIASILAITAVSFSTNAFAYTPRTFLSQEECNSQYWQSQDSNPFPRNWSLAGGNCTWYAYGRAWELLGYKPSLSLNGAHKWYTYNDGYERGTEPRLGAVACWSDDAGTVGHVAIVESIDGDNITFSESGWSYTNSYFSTPTKNKYNLNYSLGGVERKFQGYIYLPLDDSEVSSSQDSQSDTQPETITELPRVNIQDLKNNTYTNPQSISKSGISIFLNGRYLHLSNYAVNLDGTIVVPARELIEAFGGSVYWDEKNKSITGYFETSIFTANINSNQLTINGRTIIADRNTFISDDGKTMIPLRVSVTMLGGRIIGIDQHMNINIAK